MKAIFKVPQNVQFVVDNSSGTENDGYIEAKLKREGDSGMGIAFVETKFEALNSKDLADKNDIVPYSGFVTFVPGSNIASLYIIITMDEEKEEDEYFVIELKDQKQRLRKWIVARIRSLLTISIEEWESSLKNNLLITTIEEEKDREREKALILGYMRYEIYRKDMATTLDNEIAVAYENMRCAGASCAVTAEILSWTFSYELEQVYSKYIFPTPDFKTVIQNIKTKLDMGKIIRVEFLVWEGNHHFVMWKTTGEFEIGIAHGWQDVFCVRSVKHLLWDPVKSYLLRMFDPEKKK